MNIRQSIARSGLLATLIQGLSEAPVVALLGARQVGKTTLAGQVRSAWSGPSTLFDLEVSAAREALSATPGKLLRESAGLVIFDEVQRMPELFEILRPICDDRNRKAVFLLLGSASWDLIKGVSETLAGRILFVSVGGFSLAEAGTRNQDRLWMRGGFPCGLSGGVGGGMDAMDAVIHAHVSGARHSGAGFDSLFRGAGPLLANAGALSRAGLECFGTGPLYGL